MKIADDKPLIGSVEMNHTAFIEPLMQELGALRHDLTSLRSDMTSLTVRLNDGEEFDAAALAASDQSAKLISSSVEGRLSLLVQMADAIKAEARKELERINKEFNEIRNDERRADALRRGIIPFAGGDGSHSVLSVLFGAHSIGQGIFSFMTMIDSNNVRPVCRECRRAIMDFPWMDDVSKIKGSVEAWRAAFPVARAVNVMERQDIVDADFVHIRGDARVRLHIVNMQGCKRVTDAAFVHLRGIQILCMNNCNQVTITDAAFVHLRGIHTLGMNGCNQPTITNAAFVHLRGIHELGMNRCNQPTITDAAFVHLRGIHSLGMTGCNQATITDAAFEHLRGIHALYMNGCNQPTITEAALVHLVGIEVLETIGCSRDVRIAAAQVMGFIG